MTDPDGIACHVLGDDGTGQPIRYQGDDEPLTAEGEAALRSLIAADDDPVDTLASLDERSITVDWQHR